MSRHAAPSFWPRRRMTGVRIVVAVLLVTSGLVLAAAPDGRAASTASTRGTSSLTVQGKGEFAGLRVTVGQTANLVNQAVTLSWTGARPTQPAGTLFALDFMQVMQCWGDAATGPDRTQCQYGGKYTDPRGGAFVASRQLSYGSGLIDPLEPNFTGPGQSYVPFRSVTGKVSTDNSNEFFDKNTSNELPFARSTDDGTGSELIEVQTAREAPGLGCGEVLAAGKRVRNCWLVVVPRGEHEVDGSARTTASTNQITSSPLSLTNWERRLVFPLSFAPLSQICPLGHAERRTVGGESVVDAVGRWQPELCRTGPVYGFSQVPDEVARRQLSSDAPGLAFVTRPVPSTSAVAARLRYAPVSLSGLAIAFDINRQAPDSATDAVRKHNGERVSAMRLTPRLVAKLLTQSYGQGALSAPYLRGNPTNLLLDPEFLGLNPQYKGLAVSIGSLMVPAGSADLYALVWQWIAEDQEGADFVAGAPDPWGMRVNAFYQGPVLEDSSFAKADPYCQRPAGATAPLCTLDAYPYGADLHDVTRSASRGDSLSRSYFDLLGSPPSYKKVAVQPNGQHALLTLSDTVTAQRYGLPMASLRNASGAYVLPGTSSLREGLRAMVPSAAEPKFLRSDPHTPRRAAYPLTVLSYAATAPAALSAQEATDYAGLIRYAVGAGQVLGTDTGRLPAGYVPLPADLSRQALNVAADVAARRAPGGRTPGSRDRPAPVGTPTSGRAGPPPLPGTVTALPPAQTAPPQAPVVAPGPAGPSLAAVPVSSTPAVPVGPVRYALVVALLVGGLAAGLGPLLPRWASRVSSGRDRLAAAPPHHSTTRNAAPTEGGNRLLRRARHIGEFSS